MARARLKTGQSLDCRFRAQVGFLLKAAMMRSSMAMAAISSKLMSQKWKFSHGEGVSFHDEGHSSMRDRLLVSIHLIAPRAIILTGPERNRHGVTPKGFTTPMLVSNPGSRSIGNGST